MVFSNSRNRLGHRSQIVCFVDLRADQLSDLQVIYPFGDLTIRLIPNFTDIYSDCSQGDHMYHGGQMLT